MSESSNSRHIVYVVVPALILMVDVFILVVTKTYFSRDFQLSFWITSYAIVICIVLRKMYCDRDWVYVIVQFLHLSILTFTLFMFL